MIYRYITFIIYSANEQTASIKFSRYYVQKAISTKLNIWGSKGTTWSHLWNFWTPLFSMCYALRIAVDV